VASQGHQSLALSQSGIRRSNVSFQDANLLEVDLREARFIGESSFKGADLSNAHLEAVDLYSIGQGALDGAFLATAHLDRTRIRRDQLGAQVGEEVAATQNLSSEQESTTSDARQVGVRNKPWVTFRDAQEAYLNLKNNFNSIGRYADASWAYRKERAMERKALGQT
jgi:hypothetical protein